MMRSGGLGFQHPIAFWTGCTAIVAGVFAHLPMFIHASHMGYRMVGMEMDALMLIGMGVIAAGLIAAAYGLLPQVTATGHAGAGAPLQFRIADGVPLNREHWKLVAVLMVALTVDVQKPASLGFVIPGMISEYGITRQNASLLALVALTGTTIGSLLWGRIADRSGRRAAILLSALMFIGTAICGTMPEFEWNLLMCFLMGASAGGLLPITFTLMAETVPTAHRGWLLVALGGFGSLAGYLLTAASAALLVPLYSWRALWLFGLPTGALIIFLSRYIPESPRFLASCGLTREARAVLARFSGQSEPEVAAAPAQIGSNAKTSMRSLLRGSHGSITLGLLTCGLAWGLVNFGFLLWLPANLGAMGMNQGAVSALLARSALLAVPSVLIIILLYHRWSSFKTLVLFIWLTATTLLAFFAVSLLGVRSEVVMEILIVMLLVSSSGVVALLSPYAAEIYPVHLRATGSGLIAAGSKAGGILGAAAATLGLFGNLEMSALVIAAPLIMSAMMLAHSGVETRGRDLERIQTDIGSRHPYAS